MADKLLLIDGNSILNRAFYGIMGSKMLTTPDGTYTNAVYGFLAILFKTLEEVEPKYIAVAFDLKVPTARHKLYDGYKANRKGMPEELAQQMPIIKEILRAMNITIIEMEGYEADDVLGTLSKRGEKEGKEVTILSGDRDTFQLTSDNISVRIPHTQVGKTQTDIFDRKAVLEKYGIEPKKLIEVKGLMGDSSDNIPGIPGIGEKTALELIKKYNSIDKMYEKIENGTDELKGKTREKIIAGKELAYLSRTLGTINLEVPIKEKIEELNLKEWNKELVLKLFKKLNFNRFIDRFGLQSEGIVQENKMPTDIKELFNIKEIILNKNEQPEQNNLDGKTSANKEINNKNSKLLQELLQKVKKEEELFYFLEKLEKPKQVDKYEEELGNDNVQIIDKKIQSISIYFPKENEVYYIKIENIKLFIETFKEILEDKQIKKYSIKMKEDIVLLSGIGISLEGVYYDLEIAGYLLNPTNNHYKIEDLTNTYLELDMVAYLENLGLKENTNKQINLFNEQENNLEYDQYKSMLSVYLIEKLQKLLEEKLKEINSIDLFYNIEMPLVTVLAEMQLNGIYVDKEELVSFGYKLKEQLETLKQEIYTLCGEEFNVNSTQQLGKILFEKLNLPVYKKTKSGYSTDVDILEKLKSEHPVIEKILEYRTLTKLNSTYVEGLIPYINEKTQRIYSYFHQTITATGRISSTEPNLQNIPTRQEQGKLIRKAFKPEKGKIFIDADYSQIELRVLAHISKDKNMIKAFENDEDIHREVASKVFNVPFNDVTKEQRSAAKAVNFGIVYGISDFGLGEQLGVSRKKAKEYIEQYLEKYDGIRKFMEEVVEKAKEQGYVETLFNRRRYIPELASKNYMVRQFGSRAAMNTPIQGTAADIMKIAMIKVSETLKKEKINAKIVLQIHDELMLECKEDEKEEATKLLKECMENAVKLDVPLKVEVSEATNWYEAK